jgi:glucose dehydrogenase
MSRKLLLSVSVLGLTVASLAWTAPQGFAQTFVGTPVPLQFTGPAQPSAKNGEWPSYGADLRHTRYSPLDQINAANFDKLEVAWRFKTDAFGPFPEYKLEGTPIMIKGVLYTTAGTGALWLRSTPRLAN